MTQPSHHLLPSAPFPTAHAPQLNMPSLWRGLPFFMLAALALSISAWAFFQSSSPGRRLPSGPVFIASINDPDAVELSRARRLVLAPWAPLADSLAKYGRLPAASIAVTRDQRSILASSSSFSRLAADGSRCLVDIQLGERGEGALARSIMDISKSSLLSDLALIGRLNEFEALHELGHCAQRRSPSLDFPGASVSDSAAIAEALLSHRSDLSTLHGELFADAYAAHRYLSARVDPSSRAQALADLRLIGAWRAAETQIALSWKTSAKGCRDSHCSFAPRIRGAHHATWPMWADILSDPASFLAHDPLTSAASFSSRALATSAAAATDAHEAAAEAFGAQQAVASMINPVLPQLFGLAQRSDISRILGTQLSARSAPASYTQLGKALYLQRDALAAIISKAIADQRAGGVANESSIARSALLLPSIRAAALAHALSDDDSSGAWAAWSRVTSRADARSAASIWPHAGSSTLSLALAQHRTAWTLSTRHETPLGRGL
jgi:hypothetical protein